MDEIADKIKEDYRKNIEIKDVKFKKSKLWDTLVVKIVNNNKKYFKNTTLRNDFFYNDDIKLKYYVDHLINNYIDDMIGNNIRKLQSYKLLKNVKKNCWRINNYERNIYTRIIRWNWRLYKSIKKYRNEC